MSPRLVAEDLYSVRLAEDPRLSPDGSLVAYVEMSIDRASYEYRRGIWVIEPAGGAPRQYTGGDRDSTPRWSPDGSWLAFVRAPDPKVTPKSEAEAGRGVGKPQIWLIATSGGEATQLTSARRGAGTPTWAPDSTRLMFVAQTGEADDPEVERAQMEDRKLPAVRHISHQLSRFDGLGWIYERRSHLFEIAVTGGTARQLTDGDWNDEAPAYSPDGTRIAFSSGRRDDRWNWPATDIWVLDLGSGALTQLTLGPNLLASGASWSPDGRHLAFTSEPLMPTDGHEDLCVLAVDEPAEPQPLLTGFQPTCTDSSIDDMRVSHARQLEWSLDGGEIFFLASGRGSTQLFAAPSEGGTPRQVTAGSHRVYSYSLDARQATLAITASTPLVPGDVWVQASAAGSEATNLTLLNKELLAEIELAKPGEIEVEVPGQRPLQAWVLPGRGAPAPRPAVLEIHGGPHGMYGCSFFFEFQLLAANGFTVVYGNPRGSTGYGREFSGAVRGDWGGGDYQDVIGIIDAAIAAGGIDPDRLGVAGGSYGGYMTNWIVGHTDRFKAAITMRCVSNFATFFGTSDIGPWLTMNDFEKTPWEGLDALMERSPITYVASVHTPLLILHSENDLRCPISEAEQFFTALKYLNREVEMVRFEGQSHDLSRNGHPRSRVIRLNHILDWFQSHLTGP